MYFKLQIRTDVQANSYLYRGTRGAGGGVLDTPWDFIDKILPLVDSL